LLYNVGQIIGGGSALTKTKGSCYIEQTGVKLNSYCFMLTNKLSFAPKLPAL